VRGRIAPLLAGGVLLALAAGLVDWRPVEHDRPNVLLVSIDTLRADHLGYDGYPRDTSPNLDRLAARARRYREAWTPTPWTLPSHAALLTGSHPRALGIEDREAALPEGAPALASALQRAGYRTAAFVDSMPRGFVGAERGFARGFETFVHLPAERPGAFRYDAAVTVERAATWLAHVRRDRPFFLFLHTKSVHALPAGDAGDRDPRAFPYDKPEPWRSRWLSEEGAELTWDDPALGRGVGWLRGWNEAVASGQRRPEDMPQVRREALEALYDAGIRYVDHQLGRLLAALELHGLGENTLVVITADHGEAFGEHDLLLHKQLHRGVLRVPLLVVVPGEAAGRDVHERVTLMDVAPTILAATGTPIPPGVSGRPLPAHDAATPAEPLFTYYRSWPDGYYEAWGVRDARTSVIHHRLGRGAPFRTEVFDLASDPAESEPHPAGDDPGERERVARLLGWKASGGPGGAPRIELDAETRRHLEALGYGK